MRCGPASAAAPGAPRPAFVSNVEQVTGPGQQVEPPADGTDVATEGDLGGVDPVAQSTVPWWAWAGGLGLLVGLGAVALVVLGGRRT